MRNSPVTLVEWAQRYAARHLRVLPLHTVDEDGACSCGKQDCPSPGKHPRNANGVKGSSVAGIIFSYHASLPSGASIVIALGFCFLLSALISPQYGMITRFLRTIREGKDILHTPN